MSFVRSNINIAFNGGFWFLFSFLFFLLLLFLAVVFFLVKNELVAYCQNDVISRMEKYLEQRATGIVVSENSGSGLQGLAFVRLIGENQQYFYADNNDLSLDFEGIVNVSPRRSATWIALPGDDNYDWTISSTVMADGLIVQSGKRHPAIVHLYDRIKKTVLLCVVAAFFSAGGLAFFCRKKSLASIREAENFLAQIVEGNGEKAVAQMENHELKHLYQLLQKLISSNQLLIKEMQDSLDNVAHDLRTPMTRLRSAAEYGLQQKDGVKLAEALSDCLEESERVLAMLGVMMSVVEAESGTMRLHCEPVKLYDTLADVVSLYEYVAEERNIALEMDLDKDIIIVADSTRMTQVWANIVDNALKYGREGGYVKISAQRNQQNVIVTFQDNGMGISAGEIGRIWERLFRGDRSRSRPGLGLGLNYVRAMVEAHGGNVLAKSELGKGSTFIVKLPFTQDSC